MEKRDQAEEFVYNLCKKSFLSLWSYANPKGKKDKELCDVLVVCDPYVLIISVKNIEYKEKDDYGVDVGRWRKNAIDESVKQIYGAERWIREAKHVVTSEGKTGIDFPEISKRRIFRIAVAFGSKDQVPYGSGDMGNGFVHVFDEKSLSIIFGLLDTINDFIGYLDAKEKLISSCKKILIQGGEEDLFTLYFKNYQRFDIKADMIMVMDDFWQEFQDSDELKEYLDSIKLSYAWDSLIEIYCDDVLKGNMELMPSQSEAELAIRTMARENRQSRAVLGKGFFDFISPGREPARRSRMMLHERSKAVYVFLAVPHEEDRETRRDELGGRCFVARGLNQSFDTVVGIATENDISKAFSLDLVNLYMPSWNDECQEIMEKMRKELGYFHNMPQGL